LSDARRVIIDTDPGIDDTMAIMLALASPELRVEGLTIVRGNVGVEQCARNALTILEIAGHADIPVAVGADKPLVRPYHGHGSTVHGQDGLGETGLSGTRPVPDRRAVDFLISRISASPGELTIIALGPLTNLALAVSIEPHLPRRVREVIVMGGAVATRGNATPVAEANINNDPEAARIVFHAGWPVTLVGLDVTHKVTMTPADLQHLAAAHTPVTDLITRITPFYLGAYKRMVGIDGFYVHDPTAVAVAIRPALFETREVYVDVVTDSERTLGQTIADFRNQWKTAPNVRVCLNVDAQGILDLYLERVAGYRVPA
jgi:inosine-uridine nucleoside N-ribohydrolase